MDNFSQKTLITTKTVVSLEPTDTPPHIFSVFRIHIELE